MKIPPNYIPKNIKLDIQSLRDAGWSVAVRHWRYVGFGLNDAQLVRKPIMREVCRAINSIVGNKITQIYPRGGRTRIDIRRKNEHLFAETECSLNDIFCYKKGVGYALFRLKETLENYVKTKTAI